MNEPLVYLCPLPLDLVFEFPLIFSFPPCKSACSLLEAHSFGKTLRVLSARGIHFWNAGNQIGGNFRCIECQSSSCTVLFPILSDLWLGQSENWSHYLLRDLYYQPGFLFRSLSRGLYYSISWWTWIFALSINHSIILNYLEH